MRGCTCPSWARIPSAAARSTGCGRRTATCSGASPSELHLKHTPTLDFVYDDTLDRALRIDELLEREAEE